MHMRENRNLVLIATLTVLSMLGCGILKKKRMDDFIKGMISGAQRERASVLRDPKFKDYRVYRDGSKPGVVYEYHFSKNAAVDPNPDTSSMKAYLAKTLKKAEFFSMLMKYMRQGLYIKYIYRYDSGKVYATIILNAAAFDDIEQGKATAFEKKVNTNLAIEKGTLGMDALIASIISESMKERDKTVDPKTFSNFKVYRDGKKQGVIYEYYFAKDFKPGATFDKKTVKQGVVNAFRVSPEMKHVRPYFKKGLYFVYRYFTADQNLLLSFKVTKKDLP